MQREYSGQFEFELGTGASKEQGGSAKNKKKKSVKEDKKRTTRQAGGGREDGRLQETSSEDTHLHPVHSHSSSPLQEPGYQIIPTATTRPPQPKQLTPQTTGIYTLMSSPMALCIDETMQGFYK